MKERDLSAVEHGVMAAIVAGCGHQSYRDLAEQAGVSLGGAHAAVERLLRDRVLERCECGLGRRPTGAVG